MGAESRAGLLRLAGGKVVFVPPGRDRGGQIEAPGCRLLRRRARRGPRPGWSRLGPRLPRI